MVQSLQLMVDQKHRTTESPISSGELLLKLKGLNYVEVHRLLWANWTVSFFRSWMSHSPGLSLNLVDSPTREGAEVTPREFWEESEASPPISLCSSLPASPWNAGKKWKYPPISLCSSLPFPYLSHTQLSATLVSPERRKEWDHFITSKISHFMG